MEKAYVGGSSDDSLNYSQREGGNGVPHTNHDES